MGRGASRSKSGGMTVMKDSERKIIMKNSNISLFEFLQEGCFEKDFMAYCANRLNDYSCVHWLEPDINDVERPLQENFSQTTPSTDGQNSDCYHDAEYQTIYIMKITQFMMPIIMVTALATSILSIVSVSRIACKLYPLASYLIYLSIFDIVDLILRGGDIIIEVFTQNRVLVAIQLLNRSSCQMIPFFYNFFKHAHMSLYLAMAIDNWRFVKRPRHMNYALRYEWIRNVVIVIVAVLLTVNAQFFWTFDVTENDNKILHNRFVKSTFECTFSTTWPLAQVFTEYIWPILDHIAGEILPTIICLWFGASYFKSSTSPDSNLSKFVINLNLLLQMNYALSVISFLFGLFTLPRLIYVCFKYSYFLFLKSSNKAIKESTRSKMEFIPNSNQKFNKEEMYLQYLEFFIKYVNFIFIVIKFLILIRTVDLIKSKLWYILTFGYVKRVQSKSSDCLKCSEKSQDSFLPTVSYKHRSVSFKNPNETVTL